MKSRWTEEEFLKWKHEKKSFWDSIEWEKWNKAMCIKKLVILLVAIASPHFWLGSESIICLQVDKLHFISWLSVCLWIECNWKYWEVPNLDEIAAHSSNSLTALIIGSNTHANTNQLFHGAGLFVNLTWMQALGLPKLNYVSTSYQCWDCKKARRLRRNCTMIKV